MKVALSSDIPFLLFREGFKVETKQPGADNIVLENDALKVEFDSLRGLLKVRVMLCVYL